MLDINYICNINNIRCFGLCPQNNINRITISLLSFLATSIMKIVYGKSQRPLRSVIITINLPQILNLNINLKKIIWYLTKQINKVILFIKVKLIYEYVGHFFAISLCTDFAHCIK